MFFTFEISSLMCSDDMPNSIWKVRAIIDLSPSTGCSFFAYVITFLKCLNKSSFPNLALIICICESVIHVFYLLHKEFDIDRRILYTEILLSVRVLSYLIMHIYLHLLDADTSYERFFPITQIKKSSLTCDFLSLLHNWNCLVFFKKIFFDPSFDECDITQLRESMHLSSSIYPLYYL